MDAAEQQGPSVADTRRIIRKTLEDQFCGMEIVSVAVTEDQDVDGEPVLHVTVVHDTDREELNPSLLSGVLRHLRPALSEHGERRFPVMSFVAVEDRAEAR